MTAVKIVPSPDMANAPKNARTAALANALAVRAAAGGVIYGVGGYSTTSQFLQIHDTAGAPTNGAIPAFTFPITANSPFSVDFGAYGMFCANGIRIAISTTGPTLTLGAADSFFSVRYM